MAEQYTVNYQINVASEPAIAAIRKFQEATAQLETLTRRFDLVAKSIGKVNAAFASVGKTPLRLQVDTTAAETKLKRVLTLLNEVKAASKTAAVGGTVRVGGGVKSSAGTGTVNTKTAATGLATLQKSISTTQTAINNINKSVIAPKANTQTAINSLEALLRKINEVKANGKITITASAAGSSAAVGRSGGTTVVGGSRTAQPKITPTSGRWLGWQGGSHQYLGNVYAGTGTVVGADMLKGFGLTYGLMTLFQGIGSVVKDAVAYNNVSQTTKNILGTHDTQPNFNARFDAASALMRQVGVETKFTAPQVAEAGKFLAMAGYNVNDIRNAIRPISNIALVGDTDLGETADITTNIMTSYQIPAAQMNNAADVLTMTFTKTNTTLEDLAESFKYAGTVAHQSGLDFETASAALGVLGDAGIQGSHAGTTLRMMLLNMQNPTARAQKAWKELGISAKDDNGNLRDFNDILQDLNAKRKQMGAGEFSTLINKMFRVTAAPGALALIQSADKVKQVTDLNTYNSTGLSNDLAEAKKNTLEGKWYQFTSSFTETGMQQFEAMQQPIVDFLDRMINLMKSENFASAINVGLKVTFQALSDIADVANTIFGLVRGISKYFGWVLDIPGLGYVLRHFVKLQLVLSTIVGTLKMMVSLKASLLAVTKLNIVVSVIGVLVSRVKALVIAMGALRGMSFMQGLRNIPMLFGAAMSSPLVRGAGTLAGAVGAGAGAATGVGGAAVGAAGAAGGLGIMAGLKTVGGFLMSNPYTLAATAGIAAVGYLIYKIHENNKAVNAARQANLEWAKSFENLGVSKMQVESMNDVVIGNMRLYASQLTNEQERLQQSIDLYDRYWEAKNGGKKDEQGAKDKTKYIETEAGSTFKTMMEGADAFSWPWQNVVDENFAPSMEKLLHRKPGQGYADLVQSRWTTDMSGNSVGQEYWLDMYGGKLRIPLGSDGKINEAAAVQLALAQEGSNAENETVKKMEQFLWTHATRAQGYDDMLAVVNQARKNFMPYRWSTQWDPGISSETASDMTQYDVEHSKAFVYAQRELMSQILQIWMDLGKLEQQFDAGQQVDVMSIQRVIAHRFGVLLDPQYGIFGSPEWLKKCQEVLKTDSNGNQRSIEQMTGMINDTFTGLAGWFNDLPARYQPMFSQFLNRGYWEQMLTGVGGQTSNLSAGGWYGGKKEGDVAWFGGKKYTWKTSGVLAAGGEWVDAQGKSYSPSDATKTSTYTPPTNKWKPTAGGNGGNTHNGADQSQYKNHYQNLSAAPKQVIVRIENLMKVDKQMIDMGDERQSAAVNHIKEQLATALLDVVQDFNANIV